MYCRVEVFYVRADGTKIPSYWSLNYQREVLLNAKDCILFDPLHRYSPTKHPIHNDALILKLINVPRDFKPGNKIANEQLVEYVKALQPKLILQVAKGTHFAVTHCALLCFPQRV